MKTIPVNRSAQGLRFGIVVARFNHPISARLLRGATETLEERGADPDQIHVAWVPGAFEIPLAARKLAESKRYDALITLGSVIRGGTPHFDYVCIGVTDGVREVMRDTGCPVAFGVLTTDNLDQRSSGFPPCELTGIDYDRLTALFEPLRHDDAFRQTLTYRNSELSVVVRLLGQQAIIAADILAHIESRE